MTEAIPKIIMPLRNGIRLAHVETNYERGDKKEKGQTYYKPALSDDDPVKQKENLKVFSEWLGEDLLVKLLESKYTMACQQASEKAAEESTDPEEVLKRNTGYLEQQTFRGETISQMVERREHLMKVEIGKAHSLLQQAKEANDPMKAADVSMNLMKLVTELQTISENIEKRQRGPRKKGEGTEEEEEAEA